MVIGGAGISDSGSPGHPLTGVIDRLAHLLPAQGPISIFIHHNTLHAFEHLPFEEAVVRAGEQLRCEPFLPESRYRDKLASGRILARSSCSTASLRRLDESSRGFSRRQRRCRGFARTFRQAPGHRRPR